MESTPYVPGRVTLLGYRPKCALPRLAPALRADYQARGEWELARGVIQYATARAAGTAISMRVGVFAIIDLRGSCDPSSPFFLSE